jgi:hypothetical protein
MSTAPLTPGQVQLAEARAAKEGYVHRVLVGLDQFMNDLAGGLPDETISSRSERDAIKGDFAAKLITHGLDLIQANHGQKAEAGDVERATTVVAVEEKSGALGQSVSVSEVSSTTAGVK